MIVRWMVLAVIVVALAGCDKKIREAGADAAAMRAQ